MSKKPLVSIIMNCFNGEKYLTESLKSIQNQNYKNWELIFGIIDLQIGAEFFLKNLEIKDLNITMQKNLQTFTLQEI